MSSTSEMDLENIQDNFLSYMANVSIYLLILKIDISILGQFFKSSCTGAQSETIIEFIETTILVLKPLFQIIEQPYLLCASNVEMNSIPSTEG